LETPRSSSQDASPATRDLSSVDRTQAEPHSASIAKRFSAWVKSTYYRSATLLSASPPISGHAKAVLTAPSNRSGGTTFLHDR
jgi:hypothetical protein